MRSYSTSRDFESSGDDTTSNEGFALDHEGSENDAKPPRKGHGRGSGSPGGAYSAFPFPPGKSRNISTVIQPTASALRAAKASGRDSVILRFDQIINFDRACHTKGSKCLMCGGKDVLIPKQNKDVCKVCDSCVWLHHPTKEYIKWCKGCKRFNTLRSFEDKPEATKCGKCRERGRRGYEKRRRRLSSDMDVERESVTPSREEAPKPEAMEKDAAAILLMIKSYDGVSRERKRSRDLYDEPPPFHYGFTKAERIVPTSA